MREAESKDNASLSSLALLEDRFALNLGKQQIYGSQIAQNEEAGGFYIIPLEAPDHVNERRANMGLNNIEDYVSQWNISWDVEKYKKDLVKQPKK